MSAAASAAAITAASKPIAPFEQKSLYESERTWIDYHYFP